LRRGGSRDAGPPRRNEEPAAFAYGQDLNGDPGNASVEIGWPRGSIDRGVGRAVQGEIDRGDQR